MILFLKDNHVKKDKKIGRKMAEEEKEHMQRCARGIYAEKLKKAGFISYNSDDLSWYRVINNEILNTVYLFSSLNMFSITPLRMEVGYGMHPLFIPAPIPQKIIFFDYWEDEVMQVVYPHCRREVYDQITRVTCYDTPGRGAEFLDDEIFPAFAQASTEDEVYRIHAKNYLINNEKHYSNGGKKQIYGSDSLIDEAIYFNDNEMQRMLLEQVRDQYISLKEGRMTSNRKKRLEWKRAQLEALQDGKKHEILQILETRKIRFANELNRKLNIII